MRVGMEEWGAWGGKEGGAINLMFASPSNSYIKALPPKVIVLDVGCLGS